MEDKTLLELFKKVGEAVYTHQELIKQANKAQESVEYLDEKGLFSAVPAED